MKRETGIMYFLAISSLLNVLIRFNREWVMIQGIMLLLFLNNITNIKPTEKVH